MYVRSLLAQGGFANNESSPGEDHFGIDLTAQLGAGPVSIQVKTGTQNSNKDGSVSVQVETRWAELWAANPLPVYLVYVRLKKTGYSDLLEHHEAATLLHIHAYWTRVNHVGPGAVRVPRENRLTLETFTSWDEDIRLAFGKGA